MNIRKIGGLLCAAVLSISSFQTQAVGLYAGQVLNKSHRANTHNVVKNFVETRKGFGYVEFTGGKVIGNTDNEFKVTVGPHNTTLGSVLGGVDLNFNPEELNCVRGLHLSLSVGSDVPLSLSPTCDALLRADINRTISHTVAEAEVPIPEVPIDPAGVFRLGVKVGAALKVGADFAAGLEVGGFDKPNKPIEINGQRRPDFVYASVRPFISGDATAKGYASLNLLFKTVEKGVKGSLTLINAGTKAYAEAGISYEPDCECDQTKDYQYYTKLKWDASAKGGNGKIGLYCDVKLFGLARIFYAETDLISWSPIYEFNHTIYEKTAYF
ncbi:hypothetical protein GCE9029_03275 [Grimontia celer]|uniref:Outer membrane protein beta-barrel domain-containing protein n=1 Tax=Grimontia celer TaxID=1796497 RepID=A0A128F6V7_9GAMM|nr:hypothetical protein [Grimontia celer]CZF82512.1 hypothetical protein GCE9029_03275 [Grimontia celer]